MKVAFLTLSISRLAGGMLDCVRRPAQEMNVAHGVVINILAREDAESAADRQAWQPLDVNLFPAAGPASLGYARGMAAHLQVFTPELTHTFGLWTHQSMIAHAWRRRTGRPYLVTPQGMLDPWALNHGRIKKRLASILYEHRHLRDASCVHATSTAELDAVRAYGLSNPVCVIPNGVDLPSAQSFSFASPWAERVRPDRKVLLYLGRLHPKKGLTALLHALAAVRARRRSFVEAWSVVIAGWEQSGHGAELQRLALELNLGESVVFMGPLYGQNKESAYRHAAAFVLPSFSEGLPLVVLEAWSYGLPVMMTSACNLPEGFAAGAALRVNPTVDNLSDNLETLFGTADADLAKMGQNGRNLVERNFTWQQCATRLHEVYRWVLGQTHRPACVSE